MAILRAMEQHGMQASNTDSKILVKYNKLNLYFCRGFFMVKNLVLL